MKIGIESYYGDFILENDEMYTKEKLIEMYQNIILNKDEREFVPDEMVSKYGFTKKSYDGKEKLDYWIDTDIDNIYKPV